jgi:ribose transport system permease protein
VAATHRQGGLDRTALRLTEQYGLLIVLVLAFAAFSLLLPDIFPTLGNVRAMINSQAVILLLALAETVPLRSGEFDLSIAATMTASGALVAQLSVTGVSLPVTLITVVAFGLVVGLINGVLIVRVGINGFIATLGVSTAVGGLAYAITSSKIVPNVPSDVLVLARTQIAGFASIVWVGWALVLVFWYLYERTPVGRYLLFVGGSRDSARLAGLQVDRLRIGALIASSLLAALTGILFVGSVGQLDPSVAGQFLLQPFAAVFLGATAITVGRFNSVGTLLALYLLTVFVTGLQLLGADPWVSNVFNGVALVLAVSFARLAASLNTR